MEGLLTEYRENPLGVDAAHPGFTWRMISNGRGVRQSAYQVQVASSEKLLMAGEPDMWDSGKIESPQCVAVAYSGKELHSKVAYFWRVRVWNQDGVEGEFSRPATFEMGLLDPNEWHGRWITVPEQGGNGYHSQFADSANVVKWVQVDLRQPRRVASVVLCPARPYNWERDEPGFGFPVRYRLEVSDDPGFSNPRVIADRTGEDQPNPKLDPVVITVGDQNARYVRLVATTLAHPAGTRPLLALAEMEVNDAEGHSVAKGTPVTALDSIEEHGWGTKQLTNGIRTSIAPNRVCPMLRREFTVDKPITSARAYVTGLGYYELRLNGHKVGDRVLDPPRTTYTKRVFYSTYDVTGLLRHGGNAVKVLLGQGWWSTPPVFLMQLDITFADGTTTSVSSDEQWRWARSPILDNSLYGGETYDARVEQPGSDEPGFDDSKWKNVAVTDMPDTQLCAEVIQPIKVVETLTPKSISSPKPGVYVVDFGQNFSGWCRIHVRGSAGTKVTLKHAEVLFDDGTVNQQNLRSAKATDTYILSGNGDRAYEPRFTYHGFRYVQVEGYPGKLDQTSIVGCVAHTAIEPRGEFSCSNELLNSIQRNSQWGMRTNFHSIPTDCPQRDERQGWMGDAWMTSKSMLLNFNMPPAYIKFLQDIKDAEREDGAIPDTVPHIWGSNPGDPMWSIAYPMILWDTYVYTGDKRLLEQHYDGIRRYVELIRHEAKDFILSRNNYGDWVGVVETPKDLISTGAFYESARILADMAHALGKQNDEKDYRDLCASIADAFNNHFWNPGDSKPIAPGLDPHVLGGDPGQYGNGSQFSNAMPLALGIVPENRRYTTIDDLVDDVVKTHKGHLSTGFIGTVYLMDALVKCGHADVAYKIAAQQDYPGWGYMVSKGATTIWELWKYEVGPGMNSHNHPAFGLISGWFYENLAGIRPDPEKPGWEHFVVRPRVVGDLKWAKAKVQTLRGTVAVDWKLTDTGMVLNVTVPANSSATVYMPMLGRKSADIREGDRTIWHNGEAIACQDVHVHLAAPGVAIAFGVGSGSYSFELRTDN